MNRFDRKVLEVKGAPLRTSGLRTIQVNVGLRCNQRCTHCHVDASPRRKELMSWETMSFVLGLAQKVRPQLVDITGGAPELNPRTKRFITALRKDGHAVQVRTNLTILLETGMGDMMRFYKDNGVRLVASLPCYFRPEVDNVRGEGVFEKSLVALRLLNAIGYGGRPEPGLDLVFNPEKDSLPAPQASLEKEYRDELGKLGIVFNRLLTITNMPAGRFLGQLRRQGRLKDYRRLLERSFNPGTIDKLMCIDQVDVGWDGTVYDCDFNLAMGLTANLPSGSRKRPKVGDLDPVRDARRPIVTGEHCFGCTAGAGSSCGGALEK